MPPVFAGLAHVRTPFDAAAVRPDFLAVRAIRCCATLTSQSRLSHPRLLLKAAAGYELTPACLNSSYVGNDSPCGDSAPRTLAHHTLLSGERGRAACKVTGLKLSRFDAREATSSFS